MIQHALSLRSRVGLCVVLGAALFFGPWRREGYGAYPKLSFEEVAQTADLIFIGTVAGRDCATNGSAKMIFTHIHFADIRVIHATNRSRQIGLESIRLTHAGGKLHGRGVWVSVAPRFDLGRRYLVFMLDDGQVYANPVIGGPQGQFEVIQDPATRQDYVLDSGGRAVLAVGAEGIETSRRPIDFIQNGVLYYRDQPDWERERFLAPLPIATGTDSVSPATRTQAAIDAAGPLPLEEFVGYIIDTALVAPLVERRLKLTNSEGKFYTRVDGRIIEQDLAGLPGKKPESATQAEADPRIIVLGESIEEWYDSDLFACGYHDPTFAMEQVAVGRWDYDDNETAMAIWNFTIDFFRYLPDDGDYGSDNGEDEFVGFLSDAEAYAEYNFHWGSASGMTINWIDTGDPCDEIQESDVMFNAALSWTDDFLTHLGGGPNYYPGVVLHETGHTWGYMVYLKGETYAYNHPSVMNSATSDIVEDAMQIHVPDAYLMRRIYDGLTGVPQVKDVGVESYYASHGLYRSAATATNYYPGDSITIANVTVENLSPTNQANVRLRFYLSTDRTITTSDHLMGYYFYWPTFTKESYNVASYTTTVPYIASGQYNIGAIVTVDGFGGDGAPQNNATFFFDKITLYPMPPSNVQATDGTYTNRIRVTWDAVSDPAVTAYRVSRSTTETGTKTVLANVANTFYDDLSPAGGWNYYWIQSVAPSGTSLYSSSDSGYVGVTAPTGLSATDGTYTSHVALSWTAVTGASSYEIWRNTEINTATATQIATSAAASYNDTTAVPELMYYYWVKASNGISTSGFSNYDAGWRALAVPTNVQASDGTFSDKVRVNWDVVAYAGWYQVRRNTTNNLSTATIIASTAYGTSYDDTTALPMQTYYYWVRAENGFGYSQFSPPDTGYRSTPAPQKAEVVGDFGAFGLWMFHNNAWTQMSGLNPDGFIFADVDGDGDEELIGDFGIFGLWLWASDTWTHLTWYNPDSIISGDVDNDRKEELIGDFGAIGLWVWNNGDWMQLTGVNPESIAAADLDGDGDKDVVGDFGWFGIWVHLNSTWYFISPFAAESLHSGDLDGDHRDEILGDFGVHGVWLYDEYAWTALTDLNPDGLLVLDFDGDDIDEFVGDFGIQWAKPEFSGLWLWDGGAISHLNWNNAVTLIAANTDGHAGMEIVGSYLDVFGSVLGLWICDGTDWTQLNSMNPEAIAAGDIDADGIDEVIGDFGGLGLWFWDAGTWTLLAGVNAETVGSADIK